MMKHRLPVLVILTKLIFTVTLSHAENANSPAVQVPLPNPLTLEQALALADDSHPDLLMARANLESARAELMQTESRTGLRSYLDLAAERAKLTTTREFVNDNFARLVINKPIYDFGRSDALEESSAAQVSSHEHQLMDTRLRYQYEIMQRFYNVLLADFRYTVDDEEMTQRYLKYDKKRERFELGMVSELEVLEAENYYREALDERVASDKNQRSSRLLLAIALNRPEELPSDLIDPKLPFSQKEIPDSTQLFEEALQVNPTILALKQEVQAARAKVLAERARYRPTLSAEIEVGEYKRELNSRNEFGAALMLHVPIYEGNETKAEIARATAALATRTAQLKKAEQALLRTIATLVKELGILESKRKTAEQRLSFRDLDLEYKRALYEMEVQTTLSDAQARITEAQWLAKKAEYDTALIWAQINLLLGKSLIPSQEVTSP